MSTSFVDEYLVKLGAGVDASGMQRFFQALKEASTAADVSASSIAGSFFKAQTEITGGFLAIGSAALGMVDKVAMADQRYRLLALNMHISKDAARGLQIAMDALGASLDQMTWDPELRARTAQLMKDMNAMAPNGDFDAQMKKIRDIRFEFTRMEVEGQLLTFHVVNDFLSALGMGPDTLLAKLRGFNDWVTHNMPRISAILVKDFLPVWVDIKDVATATGKALAEAGLAFTNIVSFFTGDTSIEGTAFSFEKLAIAVGYVIHPFAVFAEAIANVEELLAHLVSAIALVANGDFKGAGDELGAAFHSISAKAVGGVLGGATLGVGGVMGGIGVGAALGSAAGPIGTAIGGAIGGLVGGVGGIVGGSFAGANIADAGSGSSSSTGYGDDISGMIDKQADAMGVPRFLAHAVAGHESGERQYDKNGRLMRNPGSSATGVYQLLNGTAMGLGVNSADTADNVKGGVKYLSQLLRMYGGNVLEAAGAFAVGPSEMNAMLAGLPTAHSADARSEMAAVARARGMTGDVHVGSIVIHIDGATATNEHVANVVVSRLNTLKNRQTQRNLYELQDQGVTA